MRIQLNAAAQHLDSFINLIEPIVDRAQIDVRPSAERVEARHFLEVVGSARQVAQQETDGRQTVVDIRGVGLYVQSAHVELASLLVAPLSNRLTSLVAKALDTLTNHQRYPSWRWRGRRPGAATTPPSCRLYSQVYSHANGKNWAIRCRRALPREQLENADNDVALKITLQLKHSRTVW